MYFPRSLLASALVLSLSTHIEARVVQQPADTEDNNALQDKDLEQGLLQRWPLKNIFRKRQVLDCSTPDLYVDILNEAQDFEAQTFCNKWLGIPPATTVTDYTPTVTMTTSSNSTVTTTETTRLMTTRTVVETSTLMPRAVVPRAANIAAKAAVANDIISSVITSGTDAVPLSSVNTGKAEAETGLSNACSCKNVDPTSTNTVTFTAPAVRTTVGRNILRKVTVMETRSYTSTTTITPGLNSTSVSIALNGPGSSNSSAASNSGSASSGGGSQPSAQSPAAVVNVTAASASITNPPSVTVVSSGSLAPTTLLSGLSSPVVVGIPFVCPDADGVSPHFIVDDLQYEYMIKCNTAMVTSNAVTTVNVANETACAAECSVMNNAAKKAVCQAAMFTPVPGTGSGSCLISGPTSSFVNQNGTTSIILTGISSKANNCVSADLANGSGNTTIDTALLAASVTAAGFSLSTPGLVSHSESGGEYETYYSSGYTDASGWYHYSWYKVYASSSAWWAVYATSWSCTETIPRTIVVQQPAINATSIIVAVTTIVNGNVTTVISGESTQSATNGGGVIPPSAVPASTTGGNAAFTTGFSTATSNATAGGGAQGPSPTPVSYSVLNATSIVLSGTGAQGSAALTLSGATAVYSSLGNGSVIPPSAGTSSVVAANSTAVPLSGSAAFMTSGATATFNSTGNGGAIGPTATSGGATFATSSSTATFNSTGGAGGSGPSASAVISTPANSTGPAGASGSAQATISGQTLTSYSTGTEGIVPPAASGNQTVLSTGSLSGSAVFSTAGNNSIFLSTGGGGSQGPAPITSNGTLLPTGSSGIFTAVVSGATATANSTGGEIMVPPSPTPGIGTGAPSLSANATLPTLSLAAGTQNLTVSGGTAFTSATQASGLIPPSGTSPTSAAPFNSINGSVSAGTGVFSSYSAISVFLSTGTSGAIPPSSANASVPASAATGIFSMSGATGVSLSTGSSGAIPPVSANASITAGTGVFSTSGATAIASSIGSSGAMPPTPSVNSSLPSGTGAFAASGSVAVASSVASSGVIPPLSANLSVTASISGAPIPSLNGSSFTGTGAFATSGGTAVSSAASGSGAIPPSANVTGTAAPSLAPSASSNASIILTGTAPLASGALNISTSGATGIALSTGASGLAPPTVNLTVTVTASLSVSASANASTTGPPGSIPTDLRTGAFHPTTELNSTVASLSPTLSANASMTGPPGPIDTNNRSGSFHHTTGLNSSVAGTAPIGTGTAPLQQLNSTVLPGTSVPILPTSNGGYGPQPSSIVPNITSIPGTGQPSITLPPISANLSGPLPTGNETTSSPSISERPRQGSFSESSSSGLSGTAPLPTANVTLWPGTAAVGTASASIPIASVNASIPAAGSSSLPAPSENSTAYIPSGTAAPVFPPLAANSSSPKGSAPGTAPTTSTSVSITEAPREGSISPSVNSTAFFPTATPSGPLPPLSLNASTPIGTASQAISIPSANVSVPLSTGASVSIGFSSATANYTSTFRIGTAPAPTLSANVTIPLTTGGPVSATQPVPYANSSAPYGSGTLPPSAIVPTPSMNASVPVGTGPSSVLAPPGNFTGYFPTLPTGTGAAVFPSARASLSVNSTGIFATGTGAASGSTGLPIPSYNSTISIILSTLALSTRPTPSAAPIPSLNGSAEACPTATSFSVIARTAVITTTYYETVPVGPSTCLPSAGIPRPGNGTLPSGTGANPTATSNVSRRRAGEVATQDQINAACANTGNQVFNSDFNLTANDAAFGWTSQPDDSFIMFSTVPSSNSNSTAVNAAQVQSAASTRRLTLSQPLTLCPGKQYRLSSYNRQANLLAKCTVEYLIGDRSVYTASPQERFLQRSEFFTAGTTPQDVSQDLRVRARCDGEGGAPAGTNEQGFMVVQFEDMRVTQV